VSKCSDEKASTGSGRGKRNRGANAPGPVEEESLEGRLPLLVTASQAARALGISRKALYTRVERGQMPPSSIVRLGKRTLRFDPEVLDDWITHSRASR
jgi:predicted DNA-binding transcriptional regulator AlpA